VSADGATRFLLPGIIAAGAALLVALVALNTEWVEVELPRPFTGPAATDDHYALQRLLEGVGARSTRQEDLGQLPALTETLLLQDWIWGVFPERDRALQDWVQSGGRLVISGNLARDRDGKPLDWVPLDIARSPPRKAPVPPPAVPKGNALVPPVVRNPFPLCRKVTEPEGVPAAYPEDLLGNGSPRPLELCGSWGTDRIGTRHAMLWALRSEDGIELLRVAAGRGDVTVLPRTDILANRFLLQGDNAQIAIAALRAGPGTRVRIVSDSHPAGLLDWIWHNGASAVLAGLLALLLWLWRASDRFGPRAVAPPLARRSMIEQIRGTADFLWQRGPAALHAAQLRALEDVARRQLRDYARLDRADRAEALAAATGVAAATITRAMNFGTKPTVRGLPRALAALETVRRGLLANAARRPAAPAGAAEKPSLQESSP
jgi:hypothetical protein